MADEERNLLADDLFGRLQHEVVIKLLPNNEDEYLYGARVNGGKWMINDAYYVDEVRPYLRPISSMTEEEVETLFNVIKIDEKRGDWLKVNDIGVIRLFTEAGKDFYEIAAAFDYLNSIHIDYRGLIEKGLALEAPEGMYKF